MDIRNHVRDFATRITQQLPHIQTEEATKLALINPFIREVLGYNTADLTEVVPEYTADVGVKRGEKVDYAIMREGQPLILIEAKMAGTTLREEEPSQLLRYFTVTPSARFGIYTDGITYFFYSDLDKPNLMDQRPFLQLDLNNLDPLAVDEVSKFVKSEFDPDGIRASANDLKYTQLIKRELHNELTEPSEEFARLLMGRVFTGLKTKSRTDQFMTIAKKAAEQFLRDELRGRLNTALERDEEPAPSTPAHPNDVDDGIVITDAELSAFYAVKAVLHDVVEPRRIYLRNSKRTCTVLLDDTNRRPLCRFRFSTGQKYLGLFNEERKETPVAIDDADDIYQHSDALRATARRYL